MTVLHDNLGNPIDASNPLPVDINTSEAIQPIDIQSHLQTTIQTHNAVSVALSGVSASSFYDADGFDKIAVTLINDSGTANSSINIGWSNDGTTLHGIEIIIANGTGSQRQGILDTKARYYKVYVYNNDSAAAHTMSAWVMLKA